MSKGGKKEIRYVILKSSSGLSIIDRKKKPNISLDKFLPSKDTREKAAEILSNKGFEVVDVSLTHIAIRGTRVQFQRALTSPKSEFGPSTARRGRFETKNGGKEVQRGRRSQQTGRRLARGERKSTESEVPLDLDPFVRTIGSQIPIELSNRVGSPTANPPKLGYYHLSVPDETAWHLANTAHSRNIKGNGIKIAMVDSGFMTPLHPYFKRRGYTIKKVIAFDKDEMPKQDFYGHGTAMASCILAVAPKATLIPVKAYIGTDKLFPSAFEKAIQAKPHIISCSWGISEDELPNDSTIELLDALIDQAVEEKGITVLFAAGNHPDTAVSWPSSKPNVMSVGGAYISEQNQLMASNFAVSGRSKVNPNRRCPDCCGLCGRKPSASYIALPIPPNSYFDIGISYGDHSTADDGWVITSGTSAATALVAGVAALWMQANPSLKGKPDKVKQQLMKYCRAIRRGRSSTREPANLATGAGLVQAF